MAVKTFTREYLVNELDLPYSAIEDRIIGMGRWSVYHEIIFQDNDGKHYKATYSEGATECQDERPWEYENEIDCAEVEQKEVTVLQWVEV